MQRMHPEAVKLSVVTAWITHGALAAVLIALWVVTIVFDWTPIPAWVCTGLLALSALLFVQIVPRVRAKRFSFEVEEEEVRIVRGLFWVADVLIPMVKVQHVELQSGPMMRRAELANIIVVTAATKHEIHGLKRADAEDVKKRIAAWARVREDDV